MAAVGRRPCGFQGQGGPPPPACLQGFSASVVATCPSAPSGCSGSFFFFFLGMVGWEAPETDKIWEKGSVCEGLRDGTVGGLRSMNVPSLPILAPPAPEVPSQTMGIHRPRARPREGRTSPLEGPGGRNEGEELEGGGPTPPGRLGNPHPRVTWEHSLEFAFQ